MAWPRDPPPDSHEFGYAPLPRRGAVALEFAILLPIFLLCIFGIVELGRAVMVYQVLTNSAREGARRAIIPGATDDDVLAIIDNRLQSANISGHERTIEPSLTAARSHDPLTVTISVPYEQVSWGLSFVLRNNPTFAVTVIMRKE